MPPKPKPSLPVDFEIKERIEYDTSDHEVFFSFNNDEDAIAFREWFNEIGYDDFVKWLANK